MKNSNSIRNKVRFAMKLETEEEVQDALDKIELGLIFTGKLEKEGVILKYEFYEKDREIYTFSNNGKDIEDIIAQHFLDNED